MCGPWAIPLALIAAGSVSKYFGEKKAAHAQERSFNAEQQRQKELSGQQTARFQDSLDKTQELFDPAHRQAAADAREGALTAAIKPAGDSAGAYLPGSSSAPSVVHTAADVSQAGSRATSLNLAHALAAMGGTGDQLQAINTQIGRNSQGIGQIGSFKAGSAGVLDSELKAAAQKGAFLRGVGGLAQQVGQAWLGGSLGGAGSSAVGSAGKGLSSIGNSVSAIVI